MTKMKKVLRATGKVVLWFFAILVAYALVGTILSLRPVNGNAVPGGDVVVYPYLIGLGHRFGRHR